MSHPDLLQGLAPAGLRSHRPSRFDPGRSGVSLALLPPDARAALAGLYLAILSVREAAACVCRSLAERMADAIDPDRLVEAADVLAIACANSELAAELRQAIHDVRGGALTLLVASGERLRLDPTDVRSAESAALVAADQARLMRGAFADLDPAARAADRTAAPLRPADLVRSRGTSLLGPGGVAVPLVLNDLSASAATACELEAAALMRVLSNHLDNAARFAAGGEVRLTVLSAGEGLARWVVENEPSQEHQRWLAREVGLILSRLYQGGLSRGGAGLGLAACAAVVAACFGLPSAGVAIREGYLGAKLANGVYYAWWHWPAHAASKTEKDVT